MIIKKRHKPAETIQQPALQQILDAPLEQSQSGVTEEMPKKNSAELKKDKPKKVH